MKKKLNFKKFKKGVALCLSSAMIASVVLPASVEAASWKQNKTGWWWQEDNGSYPVSQWKVINGKWYAFDERGYMRSGWFLSNGKWYYLGAANDGSMKTGWQLVNGSWYYMNPGNGDMAANQWIGIYYVNGSGVWDQEKTKDLIGWIQSGNRWWYRHADGSYTRNDWELINGSWYYFDNAGWMLANQWIGNYYVGGSGAMLTDTWIGNYYVDGSGKWVPGKTKATAQWIQSGNRCWYRHADGGYTRNGWELINGSWYYFDNAGWMLSNQWIGNYYVGGSGAMLTDTWIGNYYVDGSGKWVPDAKKDQHTHKWVAETTMINHPEEGHMENKLVSPAEGYWSVVKHPAEGHFENVLVSPEEGHTETVIVKPEVGHYENVNHPEEFHMETVHHDAVTKTVDHPEEFHMTTVHHPEESHMETVHHDAVTHTIHHEAEGYYKTVHHDAVTHTEIHYICNKCGADMGTTNESINAHIDYHENLGEAIGYGQREVTITDKAAYDEQVWVETKPEVREDVYVVDKEAWTETIIKNVCSECGAVQ